MAFGRSARVHSPERLDLVTAELQRARREASAREEGLLKQIPNYWSLSRAGRNDAIGRAIADLRYEKGDQS